MITYTKNDSLVVGLIGGVVAGLAIAAVAKKRDTNSMITYGVMGGIIGLAIAQLHNESVAPTGTQSGADGSIVGSIEDEWYGLPSLSEQENALQEYANKNWNNDDSAAMATALNSVTESDVRDLYRYYLVYRSQVTNEVNTDMPSDVMQNAKNIIQQFNLVN